MSGFKFGKHVKDYSVQTVTFFIFLDYGAKPAHHFLKPLNGFVHIFRKVNRGIFLYEIPFFRKFTHLDLYETLP